MNELSFFRLAQGIVIAFAIAIYLSYGLQFYVPVELLLPWVKAKYPDRPLLAEFALRYGLVLITCKSYLSHKYQSDNAIG